MRRLVYRLAYWLGSLKVQWMRGIRDGYDTRLDPVPPKLRGTGIKWKV